MPRAKKRPPRQHRDRGIVLIAVFKLLKGLLLIAVGIGALSLLHENVAQAARDFIAALHVDPHNYYINRALMRLRVVDDHKLEELSAGTFFYAALLLTEGGGLWMRKVWAEYLTVFITASLIPLEIYELTARFTFTRVLVILINVAVVVYLIWRLRENHLWPFKKSRH